ncbi:hypothetical protein [Halalkalibacter akibai]|uniref:Uncharacterized protein n=1 Tax=Halalkalibacter akibai (strain ATCC 43226 / DSM 21942 / CIP 109018 / JCM 9157 / 1139) TaxID=1236973 RepID=W4QRP3_HALA3|nr:hypothetical protein [Halalkalibacter akibai]GAE34318.1 hypothetical protein JCM9157_1366 [Halalkalibacter akibai JCM 9157]
MQINIKNIRINSISTIGSLNIGKTVLAGNRATSARFPKPYYEENEPDEEMDLESEKTELALPIDVPVIELPPGTQT